MSRARGKRRPGAPTARPGRGWHPLQMLRSASLRAKILGGGSVFLVAAMVAGTLVAYQYYRGVYNSIGRVNVTGLGKRPPKYTSALNILVFGTDTRAGLSPHQQSELHVGHVPSNNTDTIILVHISPGRGQVTALSLPRDLMIPQYFCQPGSHKPGQQQDLAAQVQINSLYNIGGPSCLIRSVEHLTGIYIDHFALLTFAGFVHAVDDLGGVNVCLPFAVHDRNSGLNISKGEHHIDGVRALEFWRTRYSVGNGSDLERIQRDQYLLSQVLHGVLHQGLLSSPTQLLGVIRDIAKSMTVDSAMSQADMLHIAASLSHLATSHVQFITAPNGPDPLQPAQVVLTQPQARQLFRAIAHDRTLPKRAGRKIGGGTGRAKPPQVTTIQPSKVSVTVLNGSGASGVAGAAASALASRGFNVLGHGDATTAGGAADFSYTKSVIEYSSPASLAAAETLKQQLSSVILRQNPQVSAGSLELILGSDFTSLTPQNGSGSPAPSPTPSPAVSSLAKSYGGITGNVSCKSDKTAFQGPNSP